MREEHFGRYVLLERLGYGGMAEVFVARTQSIGGFEKLLAIKRLLPFCTEDEQTVELLADEAKITVRLTHPNIVQVFDFGKVDQSYYIAMEFVDGLDLKSLVQIDELASEPLPIDVALFTSIAVLDALDFAHNKLGEDGDPLGIIHRDVSPHNILISRHGQVKLTDFGVARARISSHVSVVGDIRGKFSYMPPEQACGGEIDQRVDLFAAGAILYELLAGKQPFRSASSGEQMALLNQTVKPPSALVGDVPPELDAITLRALETSPDRRWSTAKDFANALREQLERYYPSDPLGPQQALARLVEKRLREDAELDAPIAPKMTLADYSALHDSVIWDGAAPPGPVLAGRTDEVPQPVFDAPTRAASFDVSVHGGFDTSDDMPRHLGDDDDLRDDSLHGQSITEAEGLGDNPAYMATQLAILAPTHDDLSDDGFDMEAPPTADLGPIKVAPTTLDDNDDHTMVHMRSTMREAVDPHDDDHRHDGDVGVNVRSTATSLEPMHALDSFASQTALSLPPSHDSESEVEAHRETSQPRVEPSRRRGRDSAPTLSDQDAIIDRPPRDEYLGHDDDALQRARQEVQQHLERDAAGRRGANGGSNGRGGADAAGGLTFDPKSEPASAGGYVHDARGAAPGGPRPRSSERLIDDVQRRRVPSHPALGAPPGAMPGAPVVATDVVRPPRTGSGARYIALGVIFTVALVGVVVAIALAVSGGDASDAAGSALAGKLTGSGAAQLGSADGTGSGGGTASGGSGSGGSAAVANGSGAATGVGTASGSGAANDGDGTGSGSAAAAAAPAGDTGASAGSGSAASAAAGAKDGGTGASDDDGGAAKANANGGAADAGARSQRSDSTVIRIIKLPTKRRRRRRRRWRRRRRRYGYLTVNSVPWGRVEIDGRPTRRTTPLLRWRLRVGYHRVRVFFVSSQRYSRTIRVRIRANRLTKRIIRR